MRFRRDGQLTAAKEVTWDYSQEDGFWAILGGTTVHLDEWDIDLIDAIREMRQSEANAGIIAADNALERRRFLSETSRELFQMWANELIGPSVQLDKEISELSRRAAQLAASAAAQLLVELEETKKKLAAIGLDVA